MSKAPSAWQNALTTDFDYRIVETLMVNQSNTPVVAALTTSQKPTETKHSQAWESFKKTPGLIRYIPSGMFYARFKINGVPKRESLGTKDRAHAIRLLPAKRLEMDSGVAKAALVTVDSGKTLYLAEIDARPDLAEISTHGSHYYTDVLYATWKDTHGTDLGVADPKTIGKVECMLWSKKLREEYSASIHNKVLNVARAIFKAAGLKMDDNPMMAVKRAGLPTKKLELPSVEMFDKILATIEASPVPKQLAQDRADLVRFLAFSGCRISEASEVRWKHVDFTKKMLSIVCAKRRNTSSAERVRLLPIIPPMMTLLNRLKLATPAPQPDDLVCKVTICKKPLARACRLLDVPKMTHHSFRHLFATFCIEAGIPIPTVSSWLGHLDGGVLAMKTYGHLRQEHSLKMAELVTFGVPQITAPVDVKQLKTANTLPTI